MGIGQRNGGELVAGGLQVGLVGEPVGAQRVHGLGGQEHGDGEVGKSRQFQRGGVADDQRARRNAYAGLAAECERHRRTCGEPYLRATHLQGLRTEFVGKDHTEGAATQRDMHDLAQRRVCREQAVTVGVSRGRSSPGAHPVGGLRQCVCVDVKRAGAQHEHTTGLEATEHERTSGRALRRGASFCRDHATWAVARRVGIVAWRADQRAPLP